jgi:hypothetical protein
MTNYKKHHNGADHATIASRKDTSLAVEVLARVYQEVRELLDNEVVEDTLAAAVHDKSYYHNILRDSLKTFEGMFRDLKADMEDFKRAVIGTRSFEDDHQHEFIF